MDKKEKTKPYYADKWYYFGKCTPKPIQIDGPPNGPFRAFNTKEECQAFIDHLKNENN
jgi:hypothetical protein